MRNGCLQRRCSCDRRCHRAHHRRRGAGFRIWVQEGAARPPRISARASATMAAATAIVALNDAAAAAFAAIIGGIAAYAAAREYRKSRERSYYNSQYNGLTTLFASRMAITVAAGAITTIG